MSETPSNAVFLIAAASVVIFSLVGAGVMTGVIPGFASRPPEPAAAAKSVRASTPTSQPSPDAKSENSVVRAAPDAARATIEAGERAASWAQRCPNCGRVEVVSLVDRSGTAVGSRSPGTAKGTLRYDVLVRMDDGTARTFSYETQPMFRAGDAVKVVDGTLAPN